MCRQKTHLRSAREATIRVAGAGRERNLEVVGSGLPPKHGDDSADVGQRRYDSPTAKAYGFPLFSSSRGPGRIADHDVTRSASVPWNRKAQSQPRPHRADRFAYGGYRTGRGILKATSSASASYSASANFVAYVRLPVFHDQFAPILAAQAMFVATRKRTSCRRHACDPHFYFGLASRDGNVDNNRDTTSRATCRCGASLGIYRRSAFSTDAKRQLPPFHCHSGHESEWHRVRRKHGSCIIEHRLLCKPLAEKLDHSSGV